MTEKSDLILVFPKISSESLRQSISNIDKLLEAYNLRRKNFSCAATDNIYVEVVGDTADFSKLQKEHSHLKSFNNSTFNIIH